MRVILFVLLGLSLQMAAGNAGTADKAPLTVSKINKDLKITPPCDPEAETKIPTFN